MLIFKASAPLVIHHKILQTIEGINWDSAEEDLAKTTSYWEQVFSELRQQHTSYNKKMDSKYRKWADLARYNVRLLF